MHGIQLKALPVVERISERVIRILGCNPGPMTLQGTNTYLIGRGRERMLVDTGEAKNAVYLENLRRVVVDEEHSLLRHIIITHWHHDHIGGVDGVISALSEVQAVDKDTRVWKYPLSVDAPQNSCEDIKFPESTHASAQLDATELSDNTLSAVAESGFLPVPTTRDLTILSDGMELHVDDGNTTVKVIHTPGHTQDHVALLLKQEDTIFSGDCVLGSDSTAVFENLRQYMQSLHKLLSLKSKRIFPGHGAVVEDPDVRLKFYIDHRQKREEQLIQFLRLKEQQNKSLMHITRNVYADLPNPALMPPAAVNRLHHLEKLMEEGVVIVRRGDGGEKIYAVAENNEL